MRSESGCREEVTPENESADIVRRTDVLKEDILSQTAETLCGGSGFCEEVPYGRTKTVMVDLALGLANDIKIWGSCRVLAYCQEVSNVLGLP